MTALPRTPPRTPLLKHAPLGAWVAAFWLSVIVVRGYQRPGELVHLTQMQGNIEDGPLLIVAITTTVVALLVFRFPLQAVAVALLGVLASLGTRIPELPVVLFVLADVVVGYSTATRSRRMSIAAAALPAGFAIAYQLRALSAGQQAGVSAQSALVAVTLVAWLAGNTFRQTRAHADALQLSATQHAVTEERLRIARELHDMVAHSIGIIAIQAGVGSRVMETQPAETRKALEAIEDTSRDTLSGLRRMLGALRQTDTGGDGPPLDPAPGLTDLGHLVARTQEVGVRVDVRWKGRRRPLPSDIDLSAFRIIQEAVTNVVRHSGARDCGVTVDYGADALLVEVVDLGCGGPEGASAGYGIVGMRERVSMLHGEFSAGPRPGGGFRVAARLPLPAADTGLPAPPEARTPAHDREPASGPDGRHASALDRDAGPAGDFARAHDRSRTPGHDPEPASAEAGG
jgi:signal transduction histidine kinase